MQKVFVLDKNRKPLMPCHPARARELLKAGKAAVFRRYPFTIILQERAGGDTQSIQIKLDPGSQATGIAVVADFKRGLCCLWAAELQHRGLQMRDALLSRQQLQRGRRSRKLRYRQARFSNRQRLDGWLALSLMSRVHNLQTWVRRLMKTHWLDAVCVGESGQAVLVSPHHQPLIIKAVGHGNRQVTKPDKYGFPRATRQRQKLYFGFQTGDMAKAVVTSAKKVGTYIGKVVVRASGSFNITTSTGTLQGLYHRFFTVIHQSDGYTYMKGEQALLPIAEAA
ncbi:MAG: RRXRR domain-containing protein [Anaerolineales bacterium]|nr:RRXRR domain-containing protein [Anaerolineales bacterium]